MSSLRQGLFQKQQQKLSPQQIQLMKLLQISVATLEQRIKEEIQDNPALEEGNDDNEEEYNTDDEEEKGEDQVGRCPAVPVGVFQRSVFGAGALIDQDHGGDGDAAEDVEGNQARGFDRARGLGGNFDVRERRGNGFNGG